MLAPKGEARNKARTLSVVQFSDLEKSKMASSLDQLDSLIKQAARSWKVSSQDNTNPLEIALPLLDNTSVGMAYKLPEFLKLTERISLSLQVAVNEHYQAFNKSVGSYDMIFNSINDSHTKVTSIKGTLKKFSADISSKNQMLSDLNADSKQYSDMTELLEIIEEFKTLPNKIDNLLGEKNFFKVEELITTAEHQAEQYQLWKIPALNNIKQYLISARQNLFDIIIEELNQTIYLRSKSQNLLAMVFQSNDVVEEDLSNLELYISNIINIDVLEKSSLIQTKLAEFLDVLDKHNGVILSHQQKDFDNDPYNYIYFLLQTLAKLNALPKALKILAQRHPTELHKIVTETTDEVKLKHPNLDIAKPKQQAQENEESLQENSFDKLDVEFGLSIGDLNNIVLQDFFWQIFTKFLFVFQSHRVVYEIAKKLTDLSEEKFSLSMNHYNFIEIWKNISSEVRSLINLYITNDEVVFNESHHLKNSNISSNTPLSQLTDNWNVNVLFNSKNAKSNLKLNTIFQFEEQPQEKSLNNLHSKELESFLKEVFPGFKINENLSSSLEHSTSLYLENEQSSNQETLVSPNVFNMRVILDTFLMFVQGSKVILTTSSNSNAVGINQPIDLFNEFMKKTFLPQLEDTLVYMYNNTINVNSFNIQELPKNFDNVNKQIFKSGVDFHSLITRVCSVLNTNLKYREEYCSLICQVISRFYNKYNDLYSELLPNIDQPVLNSNNNFRQLNRWLKSPELSHISLQVLNSDLKQTSRKTLSAETDIMLQTGSKILKTIDKSQILHWKNFEMLYELLGTVDWILSWLVDMRRVIAPVDKTNLDTTTMDFLKSNWTLVESKQTKASTVTNVRLTFTKDSPLLTQFNDLVKNFEKLSQDIVLAIRYDIRLRIIYYVGATITNNIWNPYRDINGICPEVKELNNLIQLFNSKLLTYVDSRLTKRIFYGIPNFIDKLFVIGAELIPVLNGFGVKKLYLNIITIQQSLRAVTIFPEDVDFTHCLAYFDSFKKGADKIIELAKSNNSLFSFQHNKNMIRLIFSQEFKDQEKIQGPPLALNRKYNEAMRELENAQK